jgi:phosphohistidine phosphatase SixA
MRHASAPFTKPDQSTAAPDNVKLERQLDAAGRQSAQTMGAAMRSLKIPLGDILSSPTYRALETLKLAGLGEPRTVAQLDEPHEGMQASPDAAQATWLRQKVAQPPRAGTDTLIVTHTPNIAAAFGQSAAGVAAGEMLVFRPDPKGGELIGRIKIDEWPQLAATH